MKQYGRSMRVKINNYINDIKKAQTIDELVWIKVDFSQDREIAGDWPTFKLLYEMVEEKSETFQEEGQKYTRARRPSWKK